MKRFLMIASMLCAGLANTALAQNNQSPTLQQSTATENNRSAHPPQPRLRKQGPAQQKRLQRGLDTTLPRNRQQRRLPPDSLRRGGATRIDTVR